MKAHALSAGLLAVLLSSSACMRPNDHAVLINGYDHDVELWSSYADGDEHRWGLIHAGETSGMVVVDCLPPEETAQIRRPDGTVLDERGELCDGDVWRFGDG